MGLERGPFSLVSKIEELLERKGSGSGLDNRDYGLGIRHAEHPLSIKFGTNFSEKPRSFGRYSSLADSGHGVFFYEHILPSLMHTS
jgi:hypothetical protein